MRSKLIISVLTLIECATVKAQISGAGTIQGLVSDSSGAVIPHARVVAADVKRGVSTERQATGAGFYSISPLQPGEYEVTATAPGFETVKRQHVVVDALKIVGLNMTLQVGASAQQVTVSDAPPPVNTSDASMGQTMRNEQYTALPLAMGNAPRDPTAFTQYMPGVTVNSSTGNTAGNVLGAQDHSQEVYVEGLSTTSPVAQGESRTLGLGVSVEAVDQFQLETAGTPAMYSGQGAANFVLKSGTNEFHGALYEYFRNTQLDARSFFSAVRSVEHQNEFGFSIGGPIKRNKLFFFSNYDGFRFATRPQASLMTVPTLAERNGDFSALLPVQIFDPASTDCSKGPCTRQAFPGNIVPADRISAVSKYFQSFLPIPENSALQNNYLGTVPVGYHDNSTTNKVDYTMTDRDTIYALYSHGHRSQTTPYRGNTLPLPYASTRAVDELPTNAQLKYTRVITPALLNQLSYGFSRFAVPITNVTISGNYPAKAGLTGLPPGEAASSFPEISWSGPNHARCLARKRRWPRVQRCIEHLHAAGWPSMDPRQTRPYIRFPDAVASDQRKAADLRESRHLELQQQSDGGIHVFGNAQHKHGKRLRQLSAGRCEYRKYRGGLCRGDGWPLPRLLLVGTKQLQSNTPPHA